MLQRAEVQFVPDSRWSRKDLRPIRQDLGRPAHTVLAGSPRCSSVFLRPGRRGLSKAALLLSLELSLSVRVSFVHTVGDKPLNAGM